MPSRKISRMLLALAVAALAMSVAGCRKRTPPAPPPLVIVPSSAEPQPGTQPAETAAAPTETKPTKTEPKPSPELVVPPAKKTPPRTTPPRTVPPVVEPPPAPAETTPKPAPPRMSPRLTPAEQAEYEKKTNAAIAAAEKNLPIVVPGWEDSTLGNIFASFCIKGDLKSGTVKSGIEYMVYLTDWYKDNSKGKGVGFFQIGGGIAGDFPICVVPMMYQDLQLRDTPFWSYFCQISDSTTSYGSYSGAVPNEKITWGKLDVNTPKFIIESDATIVAPLIFAWILGW